MRTTTFMINTSDGGSVSFTFDDTRTLVARHQHPIQHFVSADTEPTPAAPEGSGKHPTTD